MKNFLFLEKVKVVINSINPNLRFLFFLLLFAILYSYPSILLKRPQSVHHWRQSDCASITLMYSQTGMHFFEPQTHNLTSAGNTSGYNATSEIPLQYYFIATLYKIFGYHDFIYRLVNTLIFLLGLFYLFKTCYALFDDFFWSSAIALFFFTSPVLVYYGNNFLTDTSGLAFALIAWHYFFKYYKEKNTSLFFISIFFFLLAGSSKISALMSLVALSAVFLMELTRIIKFKEHGKVFSRPIISAISILSVFGVIAAWIYYAKQYNLTNGSAYFSTWLIPIWDMDSVQIKTVLTTIRDLWMYQYFHLYSLYFLAGAFLFTLIFSKNSNRILLIISLLLFIGTCIYILLWFATFQNHDYYTINLFILLIFIMISFFWTLKSRFPRVFSNVFVKTIFLGFLIFNVAHAHENQKYRYNGWWTEYPEYKDYHVVTPYLRSIGIAPLDTVICLPDGTHFTLYLMNQRGWTACLSHNFDSASVASSISLGAKYLIVNGEETLKQPYLQSFMTRPVGEFNAIKIFRLGNSESVLSTPAPQ